MRVSTWIGLGLVALSTVACGGAGEPASGTGGHSGHGHEGTGGSGGAVAEKTSITVLTRDQNTIPVAAIPVVVNDASGAVVAVTNTASDGTVEVTVPKGGSVSAFQSQGLAFTVTSVVDPPAAATVRFTLYQPAPPEPTLTGADSTTFDLQFQKVPAGAPKVEVTGCAGRVDVLGPSYQASYHNDTCPLQPTSSFLAMVRDDQDVPVAWGTDLDVPTSPGNTVSRTIPLSHSDVDTLVASGKNIPSGFTNVSLSIDPSDPAFPAPPYWRASPSTLKDAYNQTFVLPHAVFSSYRISEVIATPGGGPVGTGFDRYRTYSVLPSASTLDVGSIAQVSANPLDLSDATHPQATWNVGAGSRGDFGMLILQWSGGAASFEYDVYFPVDHPTSFKVPDMPQELSGYAPTATSTFEGVWVGYTDDESVTGYEKTALFQDPAPADGLGSVRSRAYNRTSP